MKKIYKGNKFFNIICFIGIIISFFWSIYNLNKFDKIKLNYDGAYYNQLLYADLAATWNIADKFKKELDQGNNFFSSIPSYERFLLPSIIVGFYYHLINKDIYTNSNDGKLVIKEKNFKINILLIQIFFYFFTLYLFYTEIKKKNNGLILKIVIFFFCLEPSLLQWHSSFWSESIFLSLMLLLFFFLLKNSQNIFINLSIGIIVGLMFIQRGVSFLYIFPVLVYFILVFKNNLKPLIFALIGFILFIFAIGYNNYKKTSYFYILPWKHQYSSYYHYFAHDLVAHRKNINSRDAKKFLENEEKKWILENKINTQSIADISKNINYRNKIFLEEVSKSPLYFSKLFLKRVIVMSIIHPFWVNQHFYFDRTDPQAKNNPKEYYNKNLYKNLPYSFFIYFFTIIGLFQIFKEILKKREISTINKFYIFNFFSILYFILISGLWGNPKYFAPCMISISFFFSIGFKYIFDKYKYKLNF